MMRLLAAAVIALALASAIAFAFALPGEKWAQVDPDIGKWIRGLVAPASPIPCCDLTDGETTQQDVKQGLYWVQIDGQWWSVPEDRVVREGNKLGRPIVWYTRVWSVAGNGFVPAIRCFLPGALF